MSRRRRRIVKRPRELAPDAWDPVGPFLHESDAILARRWEEEMDWGTTPADWRRTWNLPVEVAR